MDTKNRVRPQVAMTLDREDIAELDRLAAMQPFGASRSSVARYIIKRGLKEWAHDPQAFPIPQQTS